MTWSYSGDPTASPKDAVRFLTGDTDTTEQQLQDEEIAFLVTTWQNKNSVYWTASTAADAIAAKYSREVTLSADNQTLSASELQQKYISMGIKLRAMHFALLAGGNVDVGGITIGEQPQPDVKPTAFGRGMHDNLWAGQQDEGDWNSASQYLYFPEIWGTY